MPGFISNQVLRPVNESDPYIVTLSPERCRKKLLLSRMYWRCMSAFKQKVF